MKKEIDIILKKFDKEFPLFNPKIKYSKEEISELKEYRNKMEKWITSELINQYSDGYWRAIKFLHQSFEYEINKVANDITLSKNQAFQKLLKAIK